MRLWHIADLGEKDESLFIGEIHTNWRQEISGSQLNVTFDGPITDHELSDDCGVMIMGSEPDQFWHDNKGAKLNAIRTEKGSWMLILLLFDLVKNISNGMRLLMLALRRQMVNL